VIHGHLSVRHDKNPNRFFMSKAIAPELIVDADIMEFDLDSKPIDARGREGYQERFIHSEIFRARPEVNAVVHAHTPSLLPFTASDVPLQPVQQQVTFLPAKVAMFKNGERGDTIVNIEQARAMVKALGNDGASRVATATHYLPDSSPAGRWFQSIRRARWIAVTVVCQPVTTSSHGGDD